MANQDLHVLWTLIICCLKASRCIDGYLLFAILIKGVVSISLVRRLSSTQTPSSVRTLTFLMSTKCEGVFNRKR